MRADLVMRCCHRPRANRPESHSSRRSPLPSMAPRSVLNRHDSTLLVFIRSRLVSRFSPHPYAFNRPLSFPLLAISFQLSAALSRTVRLKPDFTASA
jgi:hypothetical protein